MFKQLRKFFNKPDKAQEALIQEDLELFNKKVDNYRRKANDDDRAYTKKANSVCPNCEETNIVDKIQRTNGSGSVSGSFLFGTGGVYGSSSLDTDPVNHCNSCGNQWKKTKSSWTSSTDASHEIIRNAAKYIADNDNSWYKKYFDITDGMYAESVFRCASKFDGLLFHTPIKLTLSQCRKQYKSVYDE